MELVKYFKSREVDKSILGPFRVLGVFVVERT